MKKAEQHLVTILNKIGHQFNGTLSAFDIKLYHSSQQAAIATFAITHTTSNNGQWTSLTTNNIIRYLNDYDAGGDFYIGYKQSELEAQSAKAINKDIFWNGEPCGGCDATWHTYYEQYAPFLDIVAFSVAETEMPADVLFDPSILTYHNDKNFGLNLNLTTKCDLAPFFNQEEDYIAEAYIYHTALVLLEAIAFSTREGNQLSNSTRQEAKRELFSHKEAWGTIHDRARKAIRGMSFDFSGMDKSCLPSDDPKVLVVESGAFG